MVWNLLLQVSFVLAPPYLYTLFMFSPYYTRHRTRNQYLIGGLCGLFGLLCLQHPALYILERPWDLHGSLLVLSYMMGGLTAGWVSLAIVLLYHVCMGWDFLASDILFYLLIVLPCLKLAMRFYFHSLRKSVQLCFLLSIYISLVYMTVSLLSDGHPALEALFQPESIKNIIQMTLLALVSMSAIVCQISYMLKYTQLQEESHQAEKLRLISELAASVAHEVRNPLQVTRGFLQLSLKSIEGKHQSYLTTAIQELDRAGDIITAFLDFAKPRMDQLERVDAGHVLEEVVSIMQSYSELNGVRLTMKGSRELYVLGDSGKLKQIYLNLLKNAVEAVHEDGRVLAVAEAEKEDVLLRIIDNGEGMTEEEIRQLGFPFYTSKQKGTGLGVMVTNRLVEAMGGTIRYHSRKGVGTEVQVRFPRWTEPSDTGETKNGPPL